MRIGNHEGERVNLIEQPANSWRTHHPVTAWVRSQTPPRTPPFRAIGKAGKPRNIKWTLLERRFPNLCGTSTAQRASFNSNTQHGPRHLQFADRPPQRRSRGRLVAVCASRTQLFQITDRRLCMGRNVGGTGKAAQALRVFHPTLLFAVPRSRARSGEALTSSIDAMQQQ